MKALNGLIIVTVAATALLSCAQRASEVHFSVKAQRSFERYLSDPDIRDFKAFAVNPEKPGRWGRSWGSRFIEKAIRDALNHCEGHGGGCEIYAIGNTVISGMTHAEVERVIHEYGARSPQEFYLKGYRKALGHKALATTPDGAYGWNWFHESVEEALSTALSYCGLYQKGEAPPCTIYEIDGVIVRDVAATARIKPAPAVVTARAERFAGEILPAIESGRLDGITSLKGMAGVLNARGIRTDWGSEWTAAAVFRELTVSGIPHFKLAVARAEDALGPDHPDVAEALDELGTLYGLQAPHNEAEALHRRALAIIEKSFGKEHQRTAEILGNVAKLEYDRGAVEAAERGYSRSLLILEKNLGPDHLEVATALDRLASIHITQNRFSEAEELFGRALTIKEHALGSEHPSLAETLALLGELYKAQRRYTEAEPVLGRALRLWETVLGPNNPDLATTIENYAYVLREIGRTAQANDMEERAKAIRAGHVPPEKL